jgi:hypothetical protein
MFYVKRFIAAGLLAFLILISAVMPTASAHYLESDNGVSAIFHIKPDDRPVTGKPTPIRYLFSDENGGFGLNNYKVDFTLSKDDKVVYTQVLEPAFFGAAAEGQATYTFTDPGAYRFQVKGVPNEPDAPAFTLNYVANVADNSVKTAAQGDGSTAALVSGFSLVMVGMVAGKAIHSGGKYQRRKN